MNDPHTSTDEPLTAGGKARREAMLGELLTSMQTLHSRRRARRRIAASAAVMIIVAGLALMFAMPRDLGTDRPNLVERPQSSNLSHSPHFTSIEFVQTDSTLPDRWQGAATAQVEIIDDATLLASLNELNRPAGLIRSEGHVWLTRDVVDRPMNGERGL